MSAHVRLGLQSTPSQTLSAPRATALPPGRQFREIAARAATSALAGVERIVPFVPGGVSTTSALRALGGSAGGASTPTNADARVDGEGGLVRESSDQAYELLALQQEIGLEQRRFTTLSNVMKARHDTAKNLVGNVR